MKVYTGTNPIKNNALKKLKNASKFWNRTSRRNATSHSNSQWSLRFIYNYTITNPKRQILCRPNPRSSSIRGLAIRINAGHGESYYLDKYSKSYKDETFSPSQRKAADVELDQMTHSTNRILSTTIVNDEENLKSLVNDLIVTINYWSSRWIVHYHPFFSVFPSHVRSISFISSGNSIEEQKCGDYGAKQAERLVHWMQNMERTNPKLRLIDKVLPVGGVGNAALNNIIDAYLLPCATNMSHKKRDGISNESTGNNESPESLGDFVQLSSVTGTHNVNPSTWIPAIYDASRVIDIMNRLHDDTDSPLKPDTNSNNAILHTWAKLCVLIAHLSSGNDKIADIDWKAFTSDAEQTDIPSSCKLKSVHDIISKMIQKIEEMETESLEGGEKSNEPDTLSYNHVIGSISRARNKDACERVEMYLKRMERAEDLAMGVPNDDSNLRPVPAFADTTTYNLVLHAISSNLSNKNPDRSKNIEAATRANEILDRMERRFEQNNREEARPLTVTYSTVLNAWAKSSHAEKAEELLNRFIALSKESNSEYVKPNLICFNIVVAAWANRGGRQAAENALRILEYMVQLAASGDLEDIFPDTITFSTVISAFARSGREDAGDRALDLLERSLKLFHDGRKQLQPDSVTFNTVLGALSKQSQIEWQKNKQRNSHISQSRAEKLLKQMKEMHEGGSTSVRPCAISYNILIDMYAKKGKIDKVKELIEEMSKAYKKGDTKMKPEAFTYNSYMYALANSRERDGMSKALDLLHEREGKNGKRSLASEAGADLYGYVNIINALAKKARFDSTVPTTIESLLTSMEQRYMSGESAVKPNIVCYNSLIDSWSKSSAEGSMKKAQDVLDRMRDISVKFNAPELLPDKVSYSTIVSAIGRRNYRDGPERANEVINKMKEAGLEPNTYTYNAVLNCLARSGRKNAAEEAEKILITMKEQSKLGNNDLTPNTITFSTVINCWARLRDKNSGERAERILDLMQNIENGNDNGISSFKVNRHTFGSVLNAWSKSIGHPDSVKRALGVLNRMEKRYENGDANVSPNEPCYNAVINTIAKSSVDGKAVLAESILKRMFESYENGNKDAKPGITTFSTIINACAYTKETDKDRVFKIARAAFKESLGETYGEPNNIVFSTFLTACNNLMKPGEYRDKLVCSVFEESRRRGMVDTNTILQLRRVASRQILGEVLKGTKLTSGDLYLNDIPHEWRSNVRSRY